MAPNLLPTGHIIIPNKAAVLSITGDMDPSIFVANCATVPAKNLYPTGVLAHYFLFGDALNITTGRPLLAEFKEAESVAVLALKVTGGRTYLYGIAIPKLIEFAASPPPVSASVEEMGRLGLWKAPRDDILALRVLENTDTHRLKDFADMFISRMPTFKKLKLRSGKDIEEYARGGFKKV